VNFTTTDRETHTDTRVTIQSITREFSVAS